MRSYYGILKLDRSATLIRYIGLSGKWLMSFTRTKTPALSNQNGHPRPAVIIPALAPVPFID